MNIFEITSRPPNSSINLFNNNSNQSKQNQMRSNNLTNQHANLKQRSSSLSTPFGNRTSNGSGIRTTYVPSSPLRYSNNSDNFVNLNNISRNNSSFNYFSTNPPGSPRLSRPLPSNSNQAGKYVARVMANNNNGQRTLVSSSTSYLQPEESTTDFINITTTRNGATVLPVYYQNDSLIKSNYTPPSSSSSSSTSSSISSNDQAQSTFIRANFKPLPNILLNSADSGVGSATAIVHTGPNNFEYSSPKLISNKHYSVLKGIRTEPSDYYTNGHNARSNFSYFNQPSKENHDSKANHFVNHIPINLIRSNEQLRSKHIDTPMSCISDNSTTTTSTVTSSNQTPSGQKSILVNRKKYPSNQNGLHSPFVQKKTVTFAT